MVDLPALVLACLVVVEVAAEEATDYEPRKYLYLTFNPTKRLVKFDKRLNKTHSSYRYTDTGEVLLVETERSNVERYTIKNITDEWVYETPHVDIFSTVVQVIRYLILNLLLFIDIL